ncbi:MAG: zinc ABC transporter substrate-binding protein [Deltaproteobacteria bacterium]|nr:MAG: zinc ABC transporter substrate-binding protein [Deltaproteobacteria bacterium]
MIQGKIMVFAALLALTGQGGPKGTIEPGEEIEILTTFQPLFSFATAVAAGSPRIRVTNLAPPGVGPHEYDPRAEAFHPAFAEAVRGAAAIVTLRTVSLSPLFDLLYPLARREKIYIVEIDPAARWTPEEPRLPFLRNPVDSRHGEPTEVINPHLWLSLSIAAILVERMGEEFAALDPGNGARYRENAARYAGRLRKLRALYAVKFSELDLPPIVALTEAFPYLTTDFDLAVTDYILSPRSPQEVGERIEQARARIVLAESPPPEEVRRIVAAQGARLCILDTLEKGRGTGNDLDPAGYLEGMTENLEKLYRAIVERQGRGEE